MAQTPPTPRAPPTVVAAPAKVLMGTTPPAQAPPPAEPFPDGLAFVNSDSGVLSFWDATATQWRTVLKG